MDEAARVRRAERVEQLEADPAQLLRRDPGARERRAQRLAGQQLHHEVQLALGGLAGVDDRDDAVVADRGGGARLGEEAVLRLGIEREVGPQHLERGLGAGEAVAHLEHDAHAAAAELALHDVPAVDDATGRGHQLRPINSARPAA